MMMKKKSVKKSAKKNSIEPKVINQFEKKGANKKDITDHGKNTEKKTAKTNVKEAQSKARITKIAPREKIVFRENKTEFFFYVFIRSLGKHFISRGQHEIFGNGDVIIKHYRCSIGMKNFGL
jgi:hypothetical protein